MKLNQKLICCLIFIFSVKLLFYRKILVISHSAQQIDVNNRSGLEEIIHRSIKRFIWKTLRRNISLNSKRTYRLNRNKKQQYNSYHEVVLFKGMHIDLDFEMFYKVKKKDHLQDIFLHKHQFQIRLNNAELCRNKNVFLIVFIHSAVAHTEERNMIRLTWGSVEKYRGKYVKHIFVLGEAAEQEKKLQSKVEEESFKHKDIVQSNFIDDYMNMTYKHVFGLYWVNKFCNHSEYVIKIDDDVILNMPKVLEYLSTENISENFLGCVYRIHDEVERFPFSKWYMSYETYPFKTFPPFCVGVAYITTTHVVAKLLPVSKKVPFLFTDDVYVGGFLTWIAGVEMENPDNFCESMEENLKENFNVMFYLYQSKHLRLLYWRSIWNRIIDGHIIT